jgi:hypothetical protein
MKSDRQTRVAAPETRKDVTTPAPSAILQTSVKSVAKPDVAEGVVKDRKSSAKPGIYCANQSCRSPRSKVSRTVQEDGATVRYRECIDCGAKFKTTEA